jgi:hypothetical protein
MKAGSWERELAAFKTRFVKSQGWNEKQAASYIRDARACLRDGRLAILPAEGEAPGDALPVFQFRTPQGWRLPVPLQLQLSTRLRPQADASGGGLGPRERVLAMIAEQGSPPQGALPKGRIKQSELKRTIAQQAARDLENICDCYEFEMACDSVWQAVLAAIRFGRRQQLAEIYADEEAMEENMRGRLMTRKGKSAKGRKRPESPLPEFRKRVQSLVYEGLKVGKDAHTMHSFVVSCLHKEDMVSDGANFVLRGATARKDTLSKWVREEFKKLRA